MLSSDVYDKHRPIFGEDEVVAFEPQIGLACNRHVIGVARQLSFDVRDSWNRGIEFARLESRRLQKHSDRSAIDA